MIPRTLVRDLHEHVGEQVSICGWVDTLRLQRKMQFVVLRDHTGSVQLVHERGGDDDTLESAIDALKPESTVVVRGEVRAMPNVKLGGIEVDVDAVETTSVAQQPLPIDESSSIDLRSDYRFLDLRRPEKYLTFVASTYVEDGMRAAVRRAGFVELHSPKLMASASEGGAEVFHVDYFERDAFLAQSPQFYKQMAVSAGMDKVFEVGPVFRAEPSFTTRHATEFTGVDIEMAWIESVEDVMDVQEEMLIEAIATVKDRVGDEVADVFGVELTVPERPFPRIELATAIDEIRARGWQGERVDLDPEGERATSRWVKETTGHEFVFVTRYPWSVRPFYHMRPPDDPTTTYSYDLLWNGIEITTGAQREHRYETLLEQAAEKGIDTAGLDFYLDCFRYGCPPHGGFGLGLGRTVMAMLQVPSVREVTFLTRTPNRLTP